MTILVTGSSGHLGEALMRILAVSGRGAVGLDQRPGAFTHLLGTLTDRAFVGRSLDGIEAILHTATLHKPHMATHSREAFVATNISGTLNLLEAAVQRDVRRFVFTSTTSAFGDALVPAPEAPAAWITEAVPAIPKNIYGITKTAAEDLCRLFHRRYGLPTVVLRTSRFFAEADDDATLRGAFDDRNLKVNEFLHRRGDIEDMARAHLVAMERAPELGFGRYVVSATTPFRTANAAELRRDPATVLERCVPGFAVIYAALGWRLPDSIDRVYDNRAARHDLGWAPVYDFPYLLGQLGRGEAPGSELARVVGAKGYHDRTFAHGPYPTE